MLFRLFVSADILFIFMTLYSINFVLLLYYLSLKFSFCFLEKKYVLYHFIGIALSLH